MLTSLFIELLGLLGSLIAGALVILTVCVIVVFFIVIFKAVKIGLKAMDKKEARKEMEGNEND